MEAARHEASAFSLAIVCCVTLALMNTGRDDLFGGLLGDEMGLGKVR